MLVLILQVEAGKFTFSVGQMVGEDQQHTGTEPSVSPFLPFSFCPYLIVILIQKYPLI